ncbi:MAG: hypothetical protein HYW78_03890, partial [Parcubacteria group bacterium]|nr:hypothetical protein [Parcubacteria group bacterium]
MITAIRELLGSKRNVILATIVFAYLLWLVVYNTIVAKNDQMHFLIEE